MSTGKDVEKLEPSYIAGQNVIRYSSFGKLFGSSSKDQSYHVYMCAKLLQLCPSLCNSMDCSLLGSSLHGILRARILERVAKPSSGDLPNPGIEHTSLMSIHWQVNFLPIVSPGKAKSYHKIQQFHSKYLSKRNQKICPHQCSQTYWQ